MGSLPEQPLDEPYDNAGISVEWELADPEGAPSVLVYVHLIGESFVVGESVDR